MANPIKAYEGGIHSRVQYAVRADGALFCRHQSKDARYGYVWSKWARYGELDIGAPLPVMIEAGFSKCYPAGMSSGWKKWRLPNV